MSHLTDTEFWNDLMHGVFGPRQGGARIIIDAEGASTGVGKTSLAVSLGLLVSKAFGYELTPEDLTLSGEAYLDRWKDHPGSEQPSVLILDELMGAGAGDARRAMASKNVNLGRSWQLMRKKRIVTITTLAHWSDADSRMQRFADYRLWCLEQPVGYFRPYEISAEFDTGDPRTVAYSDVNRIAFPNLDAQDDDLYADLAAKKDDLLGSDKFDADDVVATDDDPDPEDVERRQKIETAQRGRENGLSTREVADVVGMSQSWVTKYTEKPTDDAGESPETAEPADD